MMRIIVFPVLTLFPLFLEVLLASLNAGFAVEVKDRRFAFAGRWGNKAAQRAGHAG